MAIELGDAIWRVKADTSALKQGLSRAQSAVSQSMQNIGNASRKIGKTMTVVGGAITGTLGKMTHSWAATADEIDKMSERTGISRRVLSEFRHAAELSGSSLNDFERSIRRMERSIYHSIDPTSRQAESLQMLGLYTQELFDASPDERFMMIAEALSQLENDTVRAAIAQEIFGRGGTQMLPMLNQGAAGIEAMRQEARDLGIVYAESSVQGADFQDNLLRVQRAFEGVRNVIVETLVEALTPWMERIKDVIVQVREWMEENRELVATVTRVTAVIGAAMLAIGPLLIALPGLAAAFGGVVIAVGSLLTPVGALTAAMGVGLIAAVGAAAYYIRNNWEDIRDWTISTWNRIKDFLEENWDTIKEMAKAVGDVIVTAFGLAFDAIRTVATFVGAVFLGRMVELDDETGELNETMTGEEGLVQSMENFTESLRNAARRMEQWRLGIKLFHGMMVLAWDDMIERSAMLWSWLDAIGRTLWRIGEIMGMVLPTAQVAVEPTEQEIQAWHDQTFLEKIWPFARGGRVNILAGEEGPEFIDTPGGGRELLGVGGPGIYSVPEGSYVHTFAETMGMMGFAEGGLVSAPRADNEIAQRIGRIAREIRDTIRRSGRLSAADQADAWRAAQEAALYARQARNLIVDRNSFSFGTHDRRSYSGDALQRILSRRVPTAGGGVDHEVWQYARGGTVTGVERGVNVPITLDVDQIVIREEVDIDKITEELARRVSRGVVAEVLR